MNPSSSSIFQKLANMEDLANEIMNFPEDIHSKLQLVARGRDLNHPHDSFHNPKYRIVLRVSAPVENGQLIFKVSHFDNSDRNSSDWVHVSYPKEEVDGVVGFINGFLGNEFLGQGVRTEIIETMNTESGERVGRILLEKRHDKELTRIRQIRDAVKSLFGK